MQRTVCSPEYFTVMYMQHLEAESKLIYVIYNDQLSNIILSLLKVSAIADWDRDKLWIG